MALIACGERTLAAQATATDENGAGTHDFDAIDALMQAAVARGNMPGGVVIIGHNGAVVYRKAFGSRSLEPTREAMTADTIFDLASLTKVIATTTAVMQLVDEGRVRIDDPVAVYLPDFAQNGKAQITVRELDDALFRPAARSGFEGSVARPRHGLQNGDAGSARESARHAVCL